MPVKPTGCQGLDRFPVSIRLATGREFAAAAGLSRQGVDRSGVAAGECLHDGASAVLANAAARNALRYDETLSPDSRATTREGRT